VTLHIALKCLLVIEAQIEKALLKYIFLATFNKSDFIHYHFNNLSWPTFKTILSGFFQFGCPDGWMFVHNSCYLMTNDTMAQAQALEWCRNAGGYLAAVTSQEDTDALFLHIGGQYLWIDSTDVLTEGQWLLQTGELMTYTGFVAPQPNGGPPKIVLEWILRLATVDVLGMTRAFCMNKTFTIKSMMCDNITPNVDRQMCYNYFFTILKRVVKMCIS